MTEAAETRSSLEQPIIPISIAIDSTLAHSRMAAATQQLRDSQVALAHKSIEAKLVFNAAANQYKGLLSIYERVTKAFEKGDSVILQPDYEQKPTTPSRSRWEIYTKSQEEGSRPELLAQINGPHAHLMGVRVIGTRAEDYITKDKDETERNKQAAQQKTAKDLDDFMQAFIAKQPIWFSPPPTTPPSSQ